MAESVGFPENPHAAAVPVDPAISQDRARNRQTVSTESWRANRTGSTSRAAPKSPSQCRWSRLGCSENTSPAAPVVMAPSALPSSWSRARPAARSETQRIRQPVACAAKTSYGPGLNQILTSLTVTAAPHQRVRRCLSEGRRALQLQTTRHHNEQQPCDFRSGRRHVWPADRMPGAFSKLAAVWRSVPQAARDRKIVSRPRVVVALHSDHCRCRPDLGYPRE